MIDMHMERVIKTIPDPLNLSTLTPHPSNIPRLPLNAVCKLNQTMLANLTYGHIYISAGRICTSHNTHFRIQFWRYFSQVVIHEYSKI